MLELRYPFHSKMLVILRTHWLSVSRDPFQLVWSIIFPLLAFGVYSFRFGPRTLHVTSFDNRILSIIPYLSCVAFSGVFYGVALSVKSMINSGILETFATGVSSRLASIASILLIRIAITSLSSILLIAAISCLDHSITLLTYIRLIAGGLLGSTLIAIYSLPVALLFRSQMTLNIALQGFSLLSFSMFFATQSSRPFR